MHALSLNKWMLRLGNNLRQIINIIHEAEKGNAQEILFPNHPFLNISDKEKIFPCIGEWSELRGGSYFHTPRGLSWHEQQRIVKQYLSNILPELDKNFFARKEELICHIRSGDIFRKGGASIYYAQPPLSFYTEAFKRSNCKRIRIVTEKDMENPVIHKLKDIYKDKCSIQSESLIQDISTMVTARNFAIAKSTLSLYLPMFSKDLKFLYDSKFSIKLKGVNVNHIPMNHYLGDWRNEEWQRELMLTYDINKA